MQRIQFGPFLLGIGIFTGAMPFAALAGGEIGLIGGKRELSDNEFWEPLDEPGFFGAQLSVGSDGSPWFFDAAVLASDDDESGVIDAGFGPVEVQAESKLTELSLGALFAPSFATRFSPYLGAGVTYLRAELEVDIPSQGGSADDDDSTPGFYLRGGFAVIPVPGFSIGVDLRYVGGTDIDLFDVNGDVDYAQVGVTLGYRWGGDSAPSRTPLHRAPMQQPVIVSPVPAQTSAPAPLPVPVAPAPVQTLRAGPATAAVATALRARPQSSGKVELPLVVGSTLMLKSRMAGADGVWWYAEAGNTVGWVREGDLAQ